MKNQEWYTWKEGKSIVLDDVFEHEVVNKSDDIRIIQMDKARLERIFQTNIIGYFLCAKAAIQRIILAHFGPHVLHDFENHEHNHFVELIAQTSMSPCFALPHSL